MVQTRARPKKTVEDYMKLPEGTRAELIEGEILMSPSPKFIHQRTVSNLHVGLRQFVDARRLGVVVDAPMDVHLPGGEIVQPDVIFVASEHRAIVQDWIRGVPDLVIEVISPESIERDRIVKREIYARSGVREYWIVDSAERTVEVLRLSGSNYEPFGYFREPGSVTSSILVGLALPVHSIFE